MRDKPYAELYELRDTATLPDLLTVYSGRIDWRGLNPTTGFFRLNAVNRNHAEDVNKPVGWVLAYTVLDLVILVFWVEDERPDISQFGHSPRLTETVGQIWPPTDSFIWPPGSALTQAGLDALAAGPEPPEA